MSSSFTTDVSMSLADFHEIMANVNVVTDQAAKTANLLFDKYTILDRPLASTDTSMLGRLNLLSTINKINRIDFKSKFFSLPRQLSAVDKHASAIIKENGATSADPYVREFCLMQALNMISRESTPLPYNWDDVPFVDFIEFLNKKLEQNYLDAIDTQTDTINIPIFVLGKRAAADVACTPKKSKPNEIDDTHSKEEVH